MFLAFRTSVFVILMNLGVLMKLLFIYHLNRDGSDRIVKEDVRKGVKKRYFIWAL